MTEDEPQKIKFLKERAEAGDTEAMHTLAFIYYEGMDTEKDLKQSFSWLKQAAEAGMTEAMFDLAYTYYEGEGTEKNLKQFFYWVKKAAEAGIGEAMLRLANAYIDGEGTEKEPEQFFYWVGKAAEADVPEAMFNLAIAYMNAVGTEKKLMQYFYWMEKAANAGVPKAMFNFALAYKNGYGEERKLEKYFQWIEAAAEADVPEAMFNLALAYKDGDGTAINLEKYFQWMEKAYRFKASRALICFPCTLLLKEELITKNEYNEIVKMLLNLQQKCKEILKDKHNMEESTILSHFTKFAAINSILENKYSNYLRLYNITYFNDPLEGMSLPKSFDAGIRKCIYGDGDQILHEIEVGGKSFSVYACAFTEVVDRLDMWRAYSNNGDGYSITSTIPNNIRTAKEYGFIEGIVMRLSHQAHLDKPSEPDISKGNGKIRIYKVLYGKKEAEKTYEDLKDLLKDLQILLKNISDEKVIQTIKNLAVQILAELRYLYKDKPYKSEQEYRIIDVIDAGSEKIKCDDALEPPRLYMETVPFLFKEKSCKITIGPRVKDKDGAEVYIKHQLHKNDWSETTKIEPSKINYRRRK